MSKLVSLEEFNRTRGAGAARTGNGIPPKVSIHCLTCYWHGYRIA